MKPNFKNMFHTEAKSTLNTNLLQETQSTEVLNLMWL